MFKVNTPKVSLIIPVFNVEEYLRRCLDSVINQTLTDIEIIVVNDGSTDNSLDIILEYRAIDRRINIINKENQGPGLARNVGLSFAKSDYIVFLDSDDWLELNFLEKMYNTAISSSSDIVVSKVNNHYSNGIDIEEVVISGDPLQSLFVFGIKSYPWNKLYRSHLFQKDHFPVILFDDLVGSYLTAKKAKVISICPDSVSNYNRTNCNAITKKIGIDVFWGINKSSVTIKRDLDTSGLYYKYKKYFCYYILYSYYCSIRLVGIEDRNLPEIIKIILNDPCICKEGLRFAKQKNENFYYALISKFIEFLGSEKTAEIFDKEDVLKSEVIHVKLSNYILGYLKNHVLSDINIKEININVYGANDVSERIIPELIDNGIFIENVIDKKAEKSEFKCCDIPVKPACFLDFSKNNVVFVSSLRYFDEIRLEIINNYGKRFIVFGVKDIYNFFIQ